MNEASSEAIQVWTVANLITVSRGVLAFPVAWEVFRNDGTSFLALALFVIAAATDGIDGYVARSRHETSHLGTILDPVVDKFFGIFVFAALVSVGALPSGLLYTLVIKELLLLIGGLVFLRGKGRVVPARPVGKIATVVLFVGFACILAGVAQLGVWLSYLGVALSLSAGVDYALNGRNVLKRAG